MKKKVTVSLLFICTLSVALANVAFASKTVSNVIITGEVIHYVGDRFVPIVTLLPRDADNQSYQLFSSDSSIVAYDPETGEMVARAEGEVTITALALDTCTVLGSYTVYIQRRAIPVTGVHIWADNETYIEYIGRSVRVKIDEPFRVYASVEPTNADEQDVYIYVDPSDIAIVEENGSLVTIVDCWPCSIKAVSKDGRFQDSLFVDIITPYTEADFVLPDQVTVIEKEAFAGITVETVCLHYYVKSIGSRAFADCPNLKGIFIYNNTYIADDAFENDKNLIIYGNNEGYTRNWAETHGFRFIPVTW